MEGHTYVFIDGEYLRRRHHEAMRNFFGVDGEIDHSPIMRAAGASRVYFYDAIDYTRLLEEADSDWEARVTQRELSHACIRSLNGFHVRSGSVRPGKRRGQKEVDVLLAVDMLVHGFNGSMSRAVLVAGDIDFRPVVEELVRHGVFVNVWYHRNSFAQELPGAADFGYEIRFRDLYEWSTPAFKSSHRIPNQHRQDGDRPGQLLKMGAIADCPVEVYRHRNASVGTAEEKTWFTLWIGAGRYDSPVIQDEDLVLIEQYVAAQYGPIDWDAAPRREEIPSE